MKPLKKDSYDQNYQQKSQQQEQDDEDDYIDMEVNSFTHFISPCNSTKTLISSHQTREFEFHMSLGNIEKQPITSPADELFYKGKLLPLHLPPRLQMVENLLKDSTSIITNFEKFSENYYDTLLGTNTCTTPITNTPFESCNVSPSESCYVSRELKPDEYFRDFDNQNGIQKGFVYDNHKKSWTRKLKNKIKSLFGRSNCYEKENEHVDKKIGRSKKDSFGKNLRRKNDQDHDRRIICHRRSFSLAFKRSSCSSKTTKLSSSSSSGSSSSSSSYSSSISNSNGLYDLQLLKRSNSYKQDTETSLIQGAIAHCKQFST